MWKDDDVFALDTTGIHVLEDKTGRKLLTIAPPKNPTTRIIVKFVSEGSYSALNVKEDAAGYTVWSMRQDGTLSAAKHPSIIDAAIQAALTA